MKKSKIKAVVFDIGGVLELGEGKSVHQYMSKKLKVNVDSWFDAIDSTYADSIEGRGSEKKIVSTIVKNLEISKERFEKLMRRAYSYGFKTNKSLYKFAFNLKKKGYKISILSDQWHLSKRELIKEKYMKKFDTVVVSCDVGLRKPNPKIYRLLLKKMKLKPGEVVFIDNREWNLVPARKIGMKVVLFKDNKQTIRDLKKIGVGVR